MVPQEDHETSKADTLHTSVSASIHVMKKMTLTDVATLYRRKSTIRVIKEQTANLQLSLLLQWVDRLHFSFTWRSW